VRLEHTPRGPRFIDATPKREINRNRRFRFETRKIIAPFGKFPQFEFIDP
jgi:hypothetical protein